MLHSTMYLDSHVNWNILHILSVLLTNKNPRGNVLFAHVQSRNG